MKVEVTRDVPAVIASSSCSKCGGTTIIWRWHKSIWPNLSGCSYNDQARPSGEHLHAYCQRCGYDWFEDVADA